MNNNMNKPNLNKAPKEGITQKIGDALERVGEKVRDAGATRLGQKIYQAGNKLEHFHDARPGQKPVRK